MLAEEKIRRIIKLALEEDIGSGDITTETVIPADMPAKAEIVARQDCVVCGIEVAELVFKMLDGCIEFKKLVKDCDAVKANHVLAEVSGNARSLLSAERTALNFLQRLSGIATTTRKFLEKTRDYDVKLLDTRKTTPGLRLLEKYAVRCGGGENHRMGLYDAFLIKDNHIKLAGLENSVAEAKKTGKRIEVEVASIEEAKSAVKAGADIIMLDNLSFGDLKKAVKLIAKKAVVEVSGGVTVENIGKIAALGVDWISVGRLTHSVPSVEISMDVLRA
jgi:nicotinate-nucleotide pyrophosphorylase (carboxylating)